MDDASQAGPRANQRFRTRSALVAAAASLVGAGGNPSVAEVAEAARISRRTAYRYFPTQEQLLTEAALEALRPQIEASFEDEHDPARRVDAAVRAMQRETVANEALLRTMIRLTIERKPGDGETLPKRGVRRLEWLEAALAPARDGFTQAAYARVVAGLSLCVGAEALIVLRDICGLDAASATDVSAWAARAILRAALEESEAAAAPQRKAPRTVARRSRR